MWPNPQETADLVTFTEEILNRKLHFLCIMYTVQMVENTDQKNSKYGSFLQSKPSFQYNSAASSSKEEVIYNVFWRSAS